MTSRPAPLSVRTRKFLFSSELTVQRFFDFDFGFFTNFPATLAENLLEILGENHFALEQQLGKLSQAVAVLLKRFEGPKAPSISFFTSSSICCAVISLYGLVSAMSA